MAEVHEHGELKRALNNRQLQMIALGGTIGTGLFLGVGTAIKTAGPSVLLAYFLAGMVMYLGMRILGEMLVSNLHFRSFRDLATHYLGPWGGFVVGWMYWVCWIALGMQETVAIGIYLHDYIGAIPTWIPGILLVLVIFLLNCFSVKYFGELEFWFSLLKIITIIALIIGGFWLILSGAHNTFTFSQNGHEHTEIVKASITNLWALGGFMPKGFSGFLLGFQMTFLAYVGIELIGTTAGEVANPEVNLPKAIKAIPVRISLFYVGAVFVILCALPWNTIAELEGSPFVNIFKAIGVPAIGVVMTVVLVTAVLSSTNSGLYSTSRMLFGLAVDGQAPAAFGETNKRQVPFQALLFSFALIAIPVVLISFLEDPASAYVIFASLGTACMLVVWVILLVTYFVYRKKHPELHEASTFKAPFGRVAAGVSIAGFVVVILMMLFDPMPRLGFIMAAIAMAVIYFLYEFKIKKVEHIEEM
ncbi:MAG: amino acid permease [Lactobacillales bacterium]|jgi:D-serine/D-alanine/glycine transporter|nr:amino acid permease [Lactobacillales bacterium]